MYFLGIWYQPFCILRYVGISGEKSGVYWYPIPHPPPPRPWPGLVCSYIGPDSHSVNRVYVLKTRGYRCPPKPKSKHLLFTH